MAAGVAGPDQKEIERMARHIASQRQATGEMAWEAAAHPDPHTSRFG
jgi:hypothetical protein